MKLVQKIYPDRFILLLIFIFFLISQTAVFIKNVVPLMVNYNPYALLYKNEKGKWVFYREDNVRFFYDTKEKRLLPLPYLSLYPDKFNPARSGKYELKTTSGNLVLVPYGELFPQKFLKAISKNLKALVFFIFGLGVMYVFSRINYKVFKSKKVIYASILLSLILLFLLLFKKFLNPGNSMPSRWLIGTSFQPSEFSKIILIVFLAYYIGVKGEIEKRANFIFVLSVLIFHAILIAFQPDIGMALFIVLLGISLMVLGGVPFRLLVPSVFILGMLGAFILLIHSEHVMKRFSGWLNPLEDPYDKGYQIIKSLNAIANGGFLGAGLGKGLYASIYIRESDTDYVISLLIENLGMLGFIFILILQILFALRLFKFANRIYGIYEKLVIVGIALNFLYSVFVNYAMAMNLLPPKGIALPFISYGISNMLANFIALGIVGSIYRRNASVLNL
ncbi:FtsW/RodA/SpoVE family cell cycle protein [Aquifex pyrophilus]